MLRVFVVSSCVVLASASFALAADRKVPADYPTIAEAVAAARPGDRIVVGPGVYQENVVSSVADLQFIGKKAVWDGTSSQGVAGICLTASGGGTVVQGFTFRAGSSGEAQVQLTGDGCKVVKCTSRGQSPRFLKVTGNGLLLDACRLFAVDSTAIEIIGDAAVVQRLVVQQCDDDAIRIDGNGAQVTRCKFTMCEDYYPIRVNGDGARVTFNRFDECDGSIGVFGDGAVVEDNRVDGSGYIQVDGDNLAVRRNRVTLASNDQYGLQIGSRTAAGGGTVEDNILTQVSSTGIQVDGDARNITFRHIRITNSGTEDDEGGVTAGGQNCTFEDIFVSGAGAHGFNVTGQNNTFRGCVATDCAADGFHVAANGTTIDRCTATENSGEGLDNGGTGTTVTNSTFLKNRLDVANDGAFADFASSNTFGSGGTSTAPQVD